MIGLTFTDSNSLIESLACTCTFVYMYISLHFSSNYILMPSFTLNLFFDVHVYVVFCQLFDDMCSYGHVCVHKQA